MKRKRYSEEQIISILKEHEAGMPAQEVIRKHGIANGTFYRWKEKFSGMEISDVKRLRELEAGSAIAGVTPIPCHRDRALLETRQHQLLE